MNYYADIKFSCELLQNENVNVTYSGDLFKRNSDSVTIVFGFGDNWSYTTEQLMEKTENGFTAEIKLLNFDKINFCFRNSNYEWDNNNYQNYTAPISEPQIEEAFIINENIICEILDNLFEKDISKIENNLYSQESINISETVKETVDAKNDVSQNANLEEKIEFSVDVEKKEPISIEESIVNSTEEVELNNDLENIFNDFYQDSTNTENNIEKNINETKNSVEKQDLLTDILSKNKEENTETVTKFNMNNLIDEILSPIVHSSTFEEENLSSISSFKKEEIEVTSDEFIDNSIDNLISNLYENVTTIRPSENFSNTTIENQEIKGNFDIEDLEQEEPLINVLNSKTTEQSEESKTSETSLIEVDNGDNLLVSARSLGKFYMFKKKVKLAFYKLFVAIPKFLSSAFGEEKNNK